VLNLTVTHGFISFSLYHKAPLSEITIFYIKNGAEKDWLQNIS